MYSMEVLFSLIRGMTKSEKRYFRMMSDMQKGEKGYIILFNFLESKDVFSVTMMGELDKIFPGSTIEPARKHLYKVLMKSLRQFGAEDVEVKLMNLLQDSRILYHKGMVKLCFDQLEKAKQLALQREKFIYYTLVARQELQYLVHLQFAGISEYELIEKQEKINQILEQESKINKHSMLYEVLLLRYWKNGIVRSQKDILQLNDLLLEEYQLLNDPGYKSFEADQLHLHFQSIYFQMTGNPEGSLDVFYDLNKLFQDHEHLWRDTPLYYLQLLDGILYDLRWMGKYAEMDFFLSQLKAMATHAEGMELIIKYRILEHELNRKVDQELYEDGKKMLDEFLPQVVKEAAQLPFHLYAQLMLAICRIDISFGNYSAALKVINTILNQPVNSVNQSLYINFQLLNLLVNALMEDTDYLHYAIRSVERKLKSERKLFGTEQLILSALKRWLSYKPVKEIENQLETLSGNPFERQLIKELCLKLWISKMKFRNVSIRKLA